MPASLRELRQRRASVTTIKKVTRAMELIAASRIIKARQRAQSAAPYARELTKAVSAVATFSNVDHPLTTEAENPTRAAVLLITSDRGLAGAYSSSVIKEGEQLNQMLRQSNKEPVPYLTGRKSIAFYGFRRRDVAAKWEGFSDAPTYAHGMFASAFAAAGGEFGGTVREGRAPAGVAPFAVLDSLPLYEVVRDINKLSSNVMARQVYLTLATVDSPPPATLDKAREALARWLARRRLALPELVVENGSGLSRNERISVGGLARLLAAADASKVREEFASSLAVAAIDGTVQRRFQNGTVAGQALLKTGSLEGVRALAGYVIDNAGRRFLVAAIVNHPNAARAQGALDALVQWTYRNAASYDPKR